jgi:hypothetical protein
MALDAVLEYKLKKNNSSLNSYQAVKEYKERKEGI